MQYPEYLTPNSPTNKVGSNIINKFNKITHNKKMLSLDKAYTQEDIERFINNILKITLDAKEFFYVEPKIDGLSIALQYEKGKLIKAITRGDGYIGEDVTDNILGIIDDIPTTIKYQESIEIRGEVFITKSGFEKINNLEVKFSNPRNMASGTLRQLDKKIVKARNLSCFVYEIVSPELHKITNFSDSLVFLKEEGFKTIGTNLLTDNIDEIMEYIFNFEKTRDALDFETDGIVIKLNNVLYYEKLGFTSKFPKYNIAYKFNDELVSTKLIGITITIGRTGMVTYNAQLEPVALKGTIVSAATLHNFNYIHNLGINVGDDV
jgi:DNA ligase (NAD+)